jgi:hypothetical protein
MREKAEIYGLAHLLDRWERHALRRSTADGTEPEETIS